jgi:hypothetical protein
MWHVHVQHDDVLINAGEEGHTTMRGKATRLAEEIAHLEKEPLHLGKKVMSSHFGKMAATPGEEGCAAAWEKGIPSWEEPVTSLWEEDAASR